MYPIVRFAKEYWVQRAAPRLNVGETHAVRLICWPWDIDLWMELNNGRTLTLMDIGRIGMFQRLGLIEAFRRKGWAGTVAGASVRYRRRVRMFDRVELRSRIVGWDERFTYAEHSIWRGEECCSHALIRMAVTAGRGIIPSAEVAGVLGFPEQSPPLPDWVSAWAAADALRPWPPMADGTHSLNR
jgi:acyl-CoA thioesterase FadM